MSDCKCRPKHQTIVKSTIQRNSSDMPVQQRFTLPNTTGMTPEHIMQIQAIFGNQAVQRWLADNKNGAQIQRTPMDDFDDFEDYFPIPRGKPDGEYSPEEHSQTIIHERLDQEKAEYDRKLGEAQSEDEIIKIQDEYLATLTTIHKDAWPWGRATATC